MVESGFAHEVREQLQFRVLFRARRIRDKMLNQREIDVFQPHQILIDVFAPIRQQRHAVPVAHQAHNHRARIRNRVQVLRLF